MAPRRNLNPNNSNVVQHYSLQQQQQQQNLLLTKSTNQYQNDIEKKPSEEKFIQQTTSSSASTSASASASATTLSVVLATEKISGNMSPMLQTCNNSTNNTNGLNAANGHVNILIKSGNTGSGGGGGVGGSANDPQQYSTRCCYPNGDCLKHDSLITLNDLNDCIRVICNNENCNVGTFMHRECFEAWEVSICNSFKPLSRNGRSWNDRIKTHNVWSKKCYELIYKSCGCKCARGYLRKDSEWSPANALANGNPLHYINGNSNNNNNNHCQKNQHIPLTNGNSILNGHNNNSNNTNNNNLNNNNFDDDDEKKKQKKKRNRNINTNGIINSSNSINSTNKNNQNKIGNNNNSGQQQNSYNTQQQQQQQQQQESENESYNNLGCNPNVGVIGSGLSNHNNSNNDLQQQQQQTQDQQQQQKQIRINLNNLLNGSNNTANTNNSNNITNMTMTPTNGVLGLDLRDRTGSLSSSGAGSSGSTSPSASQSSSIDMSISPLQFNHHQQQQQQQNQQLQSQANLQQFPNSLMISSSCSLQQNDQSPIQQPAQITTNGFTKPCLLNGFSNNLLVTKQTQNQQQQQQQLVSNNIFQQLTNYEQQQLRVQQKNKEVEIYSERVRSTSGCNGIFSRRLDFSSFNLLPKTRLNSYQVKIEDEGNHGNDDTRLFILSSLAQSQMSRVACILCEEPMLVFDRYPLVDGSFFLSPKQHSPGCIEVKYEGRTLFLTSVCMSCLDGTCATRIISCRFCGERWDGSNLVLGTMYAYDIFAAMPCCTERLKCNNCFKLLLHPQKLLNFYSDYSHCVTCPYCATQDTHFVKPLSYCYTKNNIGRLQQIA